MLPAFVDDLAGGYAWIAPAPIGWVEPGWVGVVEDLFSTLGEFVARSPGAMVDVVDIGERAGRLSCDIVVDSAPEVAIMRAVESAVAIATARSALTCSRCGAPGRLRPDGPAWPATLCDDHA